MRGRNAGDTYSQRLSGSGGRLQRGREGPDRMLCLAARSGYSQGKFNKSGRLRKYYSIFTSGAYRATAPDAALPQEKTHLRVK